MPGKICREYVNLRTAVPGNTNAKTREEERLRQGVANKETRAHLGNVIYRVQEILSCEFHRLLELFIALLVRLILIPAWVQAVHTGCQVSAISVAWRLVRIVLIHT
jgi:hypothetical protein